MSKYTGSGVCTKCGLAIQEGARIMVVRPGIATHTNCYGGYPSEGQIRVKFTTGKGKETFHWECYN